LLLGQSTEGNVMSVQTQFSVFLVNKPGVLAQVLGELAKAKVNLIAMTLADSTEHGVLRLVVDQPDKARDVLKRLSVPVTETDVICVELSNRPGAMADVCSRLAAEHINISYAYATSGAGGGKTTGVFKVADMKKAMKVLQQGRLKRRKTAGLGRRPKVKP